MGPLSSSVLYLRLTFTKIISDFGFPKASPKAISRRTSYLRVRLEFLPYPHLIATFFNTCAFGPPYPFTGTSTWTWIGHPVSGLQYITSRAFHTRFPFGFVPSEYLTSLCFATRRTVLQKVPGRAVADSPGVCKQRVSGSLSLPSRGSFHLSFTVLLHYRSPGSI